MDPKARMPDIKSDVNKAPDGDKKKASGLLALLFGGGGLLATKAGLIALIVMGSAAAGGLGLAGYKIFGPGQSDRTGVRFTLFTAKPKGAEVDPNALAPVKADGSSASLDYLASAAAKDGAVSHGETATAQDGAAAADAAAAGDASPGGAAGALNADSGGAGAAGAMGKGLAGVKKLGALSHVGAGGGSSASASGGGKPGEGLPAASQSGASSAFAKGGPGAKTSSSASRGIASKRRGSSSRNQLASVMRDQRGAGSSVVAGRTYDGSGKTAGSAIGPDGGAIGMDGVGAGSGAQPKSLDKNSAPNTNTQEPPAPQAKHMVAPWEKAVSQAQMLVLLAMGLAFLSTKLDAGTWTKIARQVIGGIIVMIGAYITYLGSQVMSGPYGQTLQGSVVIAAGLGVTLMGVSSLMSAGDGLDAATGKPVAPAAGAPTGLAAINPMVLLGGGFAAVSAIALMFLPKPKPVEIEEGRKKPDIGYHRVVENVRDRT